MADERDLPDGTPRGEAPPQGDAPEHREAGGAAADGGDGSDGERDAEGPSEDGAPDDEGASGAEDAPPPGEAGEGAEDLPQGPPVVALGASAGGLEALQAFFEETEADSGLAYVVVTHHGSGHQSLLPEILRRHARPPVHWVGDGERLQPNRVYLARPQRDLFLEHGVAREAPEEDDEEKRTAERYPIDYFLRALARDRGPRAMAVILSGSGTDGTQGVRAIKAEAGVVLAQDEESAGFPSMPRSAIATGLVDDVLPPAEMPARLARYARGLSSFLPAGGSGSSPLPSGDLQRVLILLRQHTGHDFSRYAPETIQRRLLRRINLRQLDDAQQYLRYVHDAPEELDALFDELLIGVTGFFRDPEAFETLARFLPPLVRARSEEGEPLRIWIPGCSTGEEAYSLAILAREAMGRLEHDPDLQVFATDVNPKAVETARQGVFPEGIAADVGAERLQRFFARRDGTHRIAASIREALVFSVQDVLQDPPFTRVDLLACRNLLTYLTPEAQRRLVPLFHYALRPGGLLFLGGAETAAPVSERFEVLDEGWRIFRRGREAPALPQLLQQRVSTGGEPRPAERREGPAAGRRPETPLGAAAQLLLDAYAPPSLVVRSDGEIVYVHGRTGRYLEPSPGRASFNVLRMARHGLGPPLAAAMRRALSDRGDVVRESLEVRTNGHWVPVRLVVRFVRGHQDLHGTLLVSFERAGGAGDESEREPEVATTAPPPEGAEAAPRRSEEERPAAELAQELYDTRESLQSTIEDLETSNEELKSANEELQSTNEELQSTNEELETSKEELQSLNEELQTVNAELSEKIDELARSNDDMRNLLNSTDVATVFLDDELRIQRFTPQATRLIRLIDADVGRAFGDLAHSLRYDRLVEDARETLRTLRRKERAVESTEGRSYLMRVLPYLTSEKRVAGVVITFADVTEVRSAERRAEEARHFADSILDTVRESLLVLDEDLRVVRANEAFWRAFDLRREDVEGARLFELGRDLWRAPELRRLLEDVLPREQRFRDARVEGDGGDGRRRCVAINGRRLEEGLPPPGRILLAIEDVTPAADGGGAAP